MKVEISHEKRLCVETSDDIDFFPSLIKKERGRAYLMKSFETEIPFFSRRYKIKFRVVPQDNCWVKLQTMMAGGTCWDVFWMDTCFYLKNCICFTPGSSGKGCFETRRNQRWWYNHSKGVELLKGG